MIHENPISLAFKQLSDANPSIRKLGAQCLAKTLPKHKLFTIQNYLRIESSPGVSKWLALALGLIGDLSSLPVLKEKLKTESNEDTRDWLFVSITMISREDNCQNLPDLLLSKESETLKKGLQIAWPLEELPESVVKRLIQLTEYHDNTIRRWAILSLGATKSLKKSESILTNLEDEDFLIREWSEWTIAQTMDEKAIPHLILRLVDPHPRVREWAIKALGVYSNEEIYALIKKNFRQENDEFCREAIIHALRLSANPINHAQFIMTVLEYEYSSVVLLALIKFVIEKEVLKNNPEILSSIGTASRINEKDVLRSHFLSYLYFSASKSDKSALNRVLQNASLKHLYSEMTSSNEYENIKGPLIIEKTKKISGINNSPKVVVVIALKDELREFRNIVSGFRKAISFPDGYYLFELPSKDDHKITGLVVLIGGKGISRAASATLDAMYNWNPEIIINLGIAAGISKDVKIGDVVVASQIDEYLNSAKAIPGKISKEWNFQFGGESFRTNHELLKKAINFEFSYNEEFIVWQKSGNDDLLSSISETDRDFLINNALINDRPKIEDGKIASGDIVAASAEFLEWLLLRDRSYKALEMESAGVSLVAHQSKKPVKLFILRGISDYGDQRKKEMDNIGLGSLRALAMRNISRYFISLSSSGAFLRDN